MKSLNEVRLLGNLGRDAETTFTPSGVAVTKFSVATERSWKGQDGEWKTETDWHNCVMWRGEKVAEYMKKGSKVLVAGRLQTRSYDKDGEKKYVTEVVCDGSGIVLCGSGGSAGNPGSDSTPGGGRRRDSQPKDQGITDDDVPF